jgi:hypothetical protein
VNDTQYKIKYWIRFSAEATDGFLVDKPIHLQIDGFIEFKNAVPDVEYVNTSIRFIDVPILLDEEEREIREIKLKARRESPDSNRFVFSWKGDLKFVSSGAKRAMPTVWLFCKDDKCEGILFKSITFIDIAPPYITTELKIMKLTIILTLWIIYLTVITVVRDFYLLLSNNKDRR